MNVLPTVTAAQTYAAKLSVLRGGTRPQDYSAKLVIPDENIAVGFDFHVPYHDDELYAQFLSSCIDEKVTAIVLGGDFLDFPHFNPFIRRAEESSVESHLHLGGQLIRMACETVECVYYLLGNHERLLINKLDGHISLATLARMMGVGDLIESGKLIISESATIEAYRGKWWIAHPFGARGRGGIDTVAQLVRKYRVSILAGDTHQLGGLVVDGRRALAGGCMTDPRYHEYIQNGLSAGHHWTQGYYILKNGIPTSYLKGEF